MKADGIPINSSCLHGEYRVLCDMIGYEAVEKIYWEYYGRILSLPKKLLADEFVHSYITNCYENGKNARDMAREYDYTYSWVMKMIKASKD